MISRLHLAARILLGTVFLLSGILKLISSSQATELLSQVSSLDPAICRVLIVALCFLEIVMAVILFVGRKYLQPVAIVSSLTLLLFTFVGIVAVQASRPCGCFGDLVDFKTDAYFIVRNIILLLISMFVLRYSRPPDSQAL